jgi:hypothetical protein
MTREVIDMKVYGRQGGVSDNVKYLSPFEWHGSALSR